MPVPAARRGLRQKHIFRLETGIVFFSEKRLHLGYDYGDGLRFADE